MTSVHDAEHYESQQTPGKGTQVPLVITRSLLEDVRQHGEMTYPLECCGILLGRMTDGEVNVEEAFRAENTQLTQAKNRYNIGPKDLLRAQREGRARGLEIVGFYHSHPDHPAFPSFTDLQEAHWYGCSYVITSIDGTLTTPKAHQTHSFLLTGSTEDDKSLQPQPILVV